MPVSLYIKKKERKYFCTTNFSQTLSNFINNVIQNFCFTKSGIKQKYQTYNITNFDTLCISSNLLFKYTGRS